MSAAAPETILSIEIRAVAEKLPHAVPHELPVLGRLLGRLADLAHSQELELQILRDMEDGRELRVGVREAIDAQFALPDRDVHGNVIFRKFRRET